MYNQPYQPSFGQQQPSQSQYRGYQKSFQPTGYVQSFYQQQPTQFAQSAQAQNYHLSNYVGNKRDHDAYLREDSMAPSSFATSRAQTANTLNNVHGTYNVNVPTSQMTSGFQGGFQSNYQAAQPSASFHNPNQYHTANYVGDRQDHDAYLREDSMRPSSYATGRSQGMSTLNNVQGTYNVNQPTSQFSQQQSFSPYRNF